MLKRRQNIAAFFAMQAVQFSLSHLQLAGLRCGDPLGPKVLALHGWLDNAASFLPLSGFMQNVDFLALDFAGHGHSAHRSPDAHYHLMDWVQDIHALVESLGWQQFHILGHSMGGIVGSLYSACFPERVLTLTMLEAFGPLTQEAQTSAQQLRDSVLSRLEIEKKEARHPPSFSKAVIARTMAGDIDKESARILVERNLVETDDGLKWRTDRRLRTISSLRMTDEQAKAFLCGIQCPVLAVRGESGFEKIRINQAKRREWIVNLKESSCEGGHHFHMQQPQVLAEQLRAFWGLNQP
ncbi:alpha/beta hydrolase [Aliiglaciecola sp. CAU 1673]|uniref:alpha/beta fold hydrolase n=1 Tax=Aliiglaciecola sp. CAU 1673 TaxID=3032595 RepID=UPI0023D9A730|nr:alpha/beta hydrolase [Aliiglaciecola sp. CAU 1673]MDF2179834.1 alpha/beta hydrolase [Aliiglaciecola sp. CAU 1673]